MPEEIPEGIYRVRKYKETFPPLDNGHDYEYSYYIISPADEPNIIIASCIDGGHDIHEYDELPENRNNSEYEFIEVIGIEKQEVDKIYEFYKMNKEVEIILRNKF